MIFFVLAVLALCLFATPLIVEDRAARKDVKWTRYYHEGSASWLYYNLEEDETVFEEPKDFVPTDAPGGFYKAVEFLLGRRDDMEGGTSFYWSE